MNIRISTSLVDLIIMKMLWIVGSFPGKLILNDPESIADKIIWISEKEEGGEKGFIIAKVCEIVRDQAKEYVLVVKLSFQSDLLEKDIETIEPTEIMACLENCSEPGRKKVLSLTEEAMEVAPPPPPEPELALV